MFLSPFTTAGQDEVNTYQVCTKLEKAKKMGARTWSYLKSLKTTLYFMTLIQFTLILANRLNERPSNSLGNIWVTCISLLENCTDLSYKMKMRFIHYTV